MTAAGKANTAWGRRTGILSVIALMSLAGAARAYEDPTIVDLKVVDRDTGQEAAIWRWKGRLYVAGGQGDRYSLRIVNHTNGRVLVIVSVDGVNVISGETARYDGRGYVLAPYGAYDVLGWRKSETEVADFSFTALPNSYAAQTGRPGDVGVIGMAVFKEKPVAPPIMPLAVSPAPPPSLPPLPAPVLRAPAPPIAPPPDIAPPPPLPTAPAAAPPPIASASRAAAAPAYRPDDAKLGTAHGALEWSVSHVVSFVRATPEPQLVRQIQYDSRANLIAIGVISEHRPHAFPRGSGYVPDPPGRP